IGIEVDTVRPAFSPRYALAAPNSTPNTSPATTARRVHSGRGPDLASGGTTALIGRGPYAARREISRAGSARCGQRITRRRQRRHLSPTRGAPARRTATPGAPLAGDGRHATRVPRCRAARGSLGP